MWRTVPLVTSSPRFAPQRARRCLTCARKSSASSLSSARSAHRRGSSIPRSAMNWLKIVNESSRLSTDAQRKSPVSSAVFSCHLSASRSHRCSIDREVVAGARHSRLVLAQRDPRVEAWAPGVVLPPLARVVGDQQMPVAAPEDPGPGLRPAERAACAGRARGRARAPSPKRSGRSATAAADGRPRGSPRPAG